MLRTVVGSRIRLAVDASTSAFVNADAVQLETALINMAVNSRDAMNGEGRISIRVGAADEIPSTPEHAALPGTFVTISLSDTGTGIPPTLLNQIFEPFYTTKEVGKGTGLGLTQVYGFATQSGGDVRIESKLGAGTTFTIYLPQAVETELPVPLQEETAIELAPFRGRVLIVEDNEQLGEYSVQMLEDLGYSTQLMPDASSALSLLEREQHAFDVVFSDVIMPGPIDGLQLARILATRRPDLPIVLTTGYSDAIADGVADQIEVLRKPYSVEALSRLMNRLMRAKTRQLGS